MTTQEAYEHIRDELWDWVAASAAGTDDDLAALDQALTILRVQADRERETERRIREGRGQ